MKRLPRITARSALAIALAFAAAPAAGPAFAHHNPAQHTDLSARGWPVEDFSLVDQHGKTLTRQMLRGRWTFVLLGDTHSAPCTQALDALNGLYQRIATTEALKTTQVLFVSLDPQRDTPARLQSYLAPFDAGFVGGTAAPDALDRLADDMLGGNTSAGVDRAGSLVLVGPDGTVRAQFLPPFDVELLTAEYLKTRVRK
jgi:protein SCO1/2